MLQGFDVVAYFSLQAGAPGVQGVQAHAANLTTTQPDGSKADYEFWFSSAANKAAFAADPWRYAPAWGGF